MICRYNRYSVCKSCLSILGSSYVNPNGGHADNADGRLGSTPDQQHIRQKLLAQYLDSLPEDVKQIDGHQYEDFVLECSYDGYPCYNT